MFMASREYYFDVGYQFQIKSGKLSSVIVFKNIHKIKKFFRSRVSRGILYT